MARIRTIKPEFWQDEDIASLDPMTQLLAIGLLNHSDDEGYFKAHPQLIKSSVFPFSDQSLNVHGMLIQLSKIGYITLYEGSDNKKYGVVNNFVKHQKVNRPNPSKIKALIELTECSVNDQGAVTDGKEQGTGNREQGKERSSRATRKTNLPPDFEITQQMKDFYQSKNYPMPIDDATEQWLIYIRSSGAKYVDWYAAWQGGMAKQNEWYLKDNPTAKVIRMTNGISNSLLESLAP